LSFKPDSNSEILIIYEVKMANPNGDPDDENRPRMDPKTKTNIRHRREIEEVLQGLRHREVRGDEGVGVQGRWSKR